MFISIKHFSSSREAKGQKDAKYCYMKDGKYNYINCIEIAKVFRIQERGVGWEMQSRGGEKLSSAPRRNVKIMAKDLRDCRKGQESFFPQVEIPTIL